MVDNDLRHKDISDKATIEQAREQFIGMFCGKASLAVNTPLSSVFRYDKTNFNFSSFVEPEKEKKLRFTTRRNKEKDLSGGVSTISGSICLLDFQR